MTDDDFDDAIHDKNHPIPDGYTRYTVSFELDVWDTAARDPRGWDWGDILSMAVGEEPDAVVSSTWNLESVAPDGGAIIVGVVRYDFDKDTINDVYGSEVTDDTLIEECVGIVEPEGMEWKVYRS